MIMRKKEGGVWDPGQRPRQSLRLPGSNPNRREERDRGYIKGSGEREMDIQPLQFFPVDVGSLIDIIIIIIIITIVGITAIVVAFSVAELIGSFFVAFSVAELFGSFFVAGPVLLGP